MWLLVLLGVAFAAPADEIEAALLPRHDAASCTELADRYEAGVLVDALVSVAEEVAYPPWVPMRAGACLSARVGVDHRAYEAAARWVDDPAVPGLALLVLGRIDDVDETRAVHLAQRAAVRAGGSGRFGSYAKKALADSHYERVRAIGAALTPTR